MWYGIYYESNKPSLDVLSMNIEDFAIKKKKKWKLNVNWFLSFMIKDMLIDIVPYPNA